MLNLQVSRARNRYQIVTFSTSFTLSAVHVKLIGLVFAVQSHWTPALIQISRIISNQLDVKHSEEAAIVS